MIAYVTAVVIGGLALIVDQGSMALEIPASASAEFFILAVAVVGGEFVRIHIALRNGGSTVVTVGDPFTLALLFSFGLGPALLVKSLASLLDDLIRRQVWWKGLFNAAQFCLTLGAAYLVATLLGGRALEYPMEARDIFPILVSAGVYFVINLTLLNTAISLSQRSSLRSSLRDSLKERVVNQGTLLGFTPVVLGALDQSAWLFPFLAIPIVVVYHSGIVTHRQRVLADQLRELYEATRTSPRTDTSQEWERNLLERVCAMFNASSAVITMLPRGGEAQGSRTRTDVEAGRFQPWQPADLDPTKGVWARVASEDRALLLPAPITNKNLRAHYGAQNIKDVMAAPLRSEGTVTGVIGVYNRIGGNVTFTREDLNLFETLANHVSIALENNRLIEELESSLAHLTEMNQLKDDFVASVSHELRTPLTSIRGYVRTLLRPDAAFDQADQRSFLETIDRQSSRLHRLIEDLLAVSRIESQTDSSTLSPVSIRQLAEEVADELRSKAAGHEIELALPETLPLVETDPGKVHQILCNLVDNALKYTPAGTTVQVTASAHANGVSISVTDQGGGIPAGAQDKIFDRFYQVDQSATRAVGGAGLGLYICRRMAEAIGGRVWLEKSDEEGSTFSLWIPTHIPLPRRLAALSS